MQALKVTLAAAVAAGVCSGEAAAQTCNFNITNLNFGNIDVTANTAFTVSGTYSASCTGLLTATRTCPSISEGSGGTTIGSPRYLTNGTNQLAFNLFADPSHTAVWGSYFWGYPYLPPPTDIPTVILGAGSTSRAIYARIPGGQQTLPAGTYTSSFAGSYTRIAFDAFLLGLFPPDCADVTSPSGTAPFTVTATIVSNCTVSATTLDFGATGLLSANIDSANSVTVTCTAQTPYTISLDGGTSGASDPTQRKMSKGADSVTYGLYRDAARTLPWGSTIGVDTLTGIGTGLSQSHTVYGRVPPQTTPGPGTYTDTIVVTVTY